MVLPALILRLLLHPRLPTPVGQGEVAGDESVPLRRTWDRPLQPPSTYG